MPVFQCDECVSRVKFMGDEIEAAVTFILDEKGQPFDPASEDGRGDGTWERANDGEMN
jgi:hypothetical protein